MRFIGSMGLTLSMVNKVNVAWSTKSTGSTTYALTIVNRVDEVDMVHEFNK